MRDIGSGAGKLGAFEIELVRDSSHAVIGLRDTRRGEGVSRDDIGAGTEVSEMNLTNLRGLAENEEIVVAAHLAVPRIEARAAIALLVEPERLDHGAHGAVEHEDALGR